MHVARLRLTIPTGRHAERWTESVYADSFERASRFGEDEKMASISPIGSRETVAESLSGLSPENQSWLKLLMDNPSSDDLFIEGLHCHLDHASEAKFLNSLKLSKCGEWVGSTAPARLQIRLMEAAKSSQHPAYTAFRDGLTRSGGLERAYPKASI